MLSLAYWVAVATYLPPQGDSVGIPLINDLMLTVVAAPAAMAVAWICLRRYNPQTRLAAWRGDRPLRSVLATVTFGGSAVVLVTLLVADIGNAWPWYEYLWVPYEVAIIAWLLGMRAALIEQRPAERLVPQS